MDSDDLKLLLDAAHEQWVSVQAEYLDLANRANAGMRVDLNEEAALKARLDEAVTELMSVAQRIQTHLAALTRTEGQPQSQGATTSILR